MGRRLDEEGLVGVKLSAVFGKRGEGVRRGRGVVEGGRKRGREG